MRPVALLALLLSFSLVSPFVATAETPKVLRLEENITYGEMLVIGAEEDVRLPEFNVTWHARIDTGATTTSLHATDIEEFERDGAEWIRFNLRNDDTDENVETERPVERYALIKKRGEEGHHRRAVVIMDVQIGEMTRRIEVNLTDRTGFEFPVLIGRNFLEGATLVDVSRINVQGTPKSGQEGDE